MNHSKCFSNGWHFTIRFSHSFFFRQCWVNTDTFVFSDTPLCSGPITGNLLLANGLSPAQYNIINSISAFWFTTKWHKPSFWNSGLPKFPYIWSRQSQLISKGSWSHHNTWCFSILVTKLLCPPTKYTISFHTDSVSITIKK